MTPLCQLLEGGWRGGGVTLAERFAQKTNGHIRPSLDQVPVVVWLSDPVCSNRSPRC